ncbi:MAG: hypothetical protein JWO80_836 [Bryobacterales bacterium]|nr:hypothetical protein [Bryobacterales bacterium]
MSLWRPRHFFSRAGPRHRPSAIQRALGARLVSRCKRFGVPSGAARREFGGADCEEGRPARRSRSGHLCRTLPTRGFLYAAYLNGVPELAIMRQSRHSSLDTMRKYIRDRSLFHDNPAAKLGL